MTTISNLEGDLTVSADPAVERPQRKPFAQFLQEARKGGLHTELSDELAELVHACVETGKKGTLVLTVTVVPAKDEDGTVQVTDGVKVTVPKPDARPSVFFADDHGNLSRTNPRQPELPLREVPGGGSRAAQATA